MERMKNVMVTGAAGFLGSHLAMRHLKAGDRVWGVDDFSTSVADSRHWRELCAHPQFRPHRADITRPLHEWWAPELSPRMHLIYNFACPASPPRYQAMPVKTLMTCVVGTKNVLDVAAGDGSIAVHASTSEVYGDPERSPQHESYWGRVNSYGPRSCYDEGKRAAEALCHDYLRHRGVDARLVRIFNTYGPHMDPDDGRVVSNFVCQALRGERLTIYGRGAQTRSFCYVDDLVEGIVSLGLLSENPTVPINLGNPQEFTVMELARVIISMTGHEEGWEDRLRVEQLPVDDPTQRRPDVSRARELLGWEPRVSLKEGLVPTIGYFRSRLSHDEIG